MDIVNNTISINVKIDLQIEINSLQEKEYDSLSLEYKARILVDRIEVKGIATPDKLAKEFTRNY